MMIDKCALIFLVLLATSMVMQFVRAKKRQKLVRRADRSLLLVNNQAKWDAVEASFDFMFKDYRKLQIIKRNMSGFPDDFKEEFERYKLFSRAEILITTSMLMFGGFAYYLCN